jgi:hypothetical protein
MMLRITQDLTLQQILKHPDLVSRFLQGHQVLNLMEGYHPIDLLLWESFLENRKMSGLLGGWVGCLDP